MTIYTELKCQQVWKKYTLNGLCNPTIPRISDTFQHRIFVLVLCESSTIKNSHFRNPSLWQILLPNSRKTATNTWTKWPVMKTLYLSTNFQFFLNKWLVIKIQHVEGIYANINLDITHHHIFSGPGAEDLHKYIPIKALSILTQKSMNPNTWWPSRFILCNIQRKKYNQTNKSTSLGIWLFT